MTMEIFIPIYILRIFFMHSLPNAHKKMKAHWEGYVTICVHISYLKLHNGFL
jgi:hypothetical protein